MNRKDDHELNWVWNNELASMVSNDSVFGSFVWKSMGAFRLHDWGDIGDAQWKLNDENIDRNGFVIGRYSMGVFQLEITDVGDHIAYVRLCA